MSQKPTYPAAAIPYLMIRGAADALDFYKKAFGAEETMRFPMPNGLIGHAEIRIEGAPVFLADEGPGAGMQSPKQVGGTTVMVCVYVADVDAFAQRAERAGARVLRPSGIYAVNVGDGPPLAHARGRVAAVRSVFAHVCVLAEPPVLRGRRFGNLVVVASGRELPVSGLTRRIATDPFPARLVEGAALDRFVAGCAPIVDAHAEPSPAMPPDVFA